MTAAATEGQAPAGSQTVDAFADADAARAAAEELVVRGEVFQAIDLLTEANRRWRDAAIEARLVRLRHDAFAFLEAGEPAGSWPPDVPDVFADVEGIPEVTPDELTSEALGAGIVHHGALIVRGLLDHAQVDHLVADIDRALDLCEAGMNRDVPVEETTPWYVPFNPGLGYNLGWGRRFVIDGGGLWTVDAPRVMFELVELYRRTRLDEIIGGYLGERPAISVKKCTLRKVPADSGSDWHQDGAFLGEGIRTVNVWLTLTDCGVDAPGLDIVSTRLPEVVETGTEGAKFDWSVGPGVVDKVAGDRVVRPHFAAGDAILFDELNLHRTAVEPGMVHDRYAIETWFFAPSVYPHSQIPVVL